MSGLFYKSINFLLRSVKFMKISFLSICSVTVLYLTAQDYEYTKLDKSTTETINSKSFSIDQSSYCRNRSDPESVIWEENFSSPILNNSHWSYSIGNAFNSGTTTVYGWGNNEQQFYKDKKYKNTNTNDNLFIEDGDLKIQPMKKKYRGFAYTSARIHTQNKISYSYPSKLTFCFKNPKGIGLWPAFWLLPLSTDTWPTGGEIDIMEARGRITNIVSSALHYGNSPLDKNFTVKEISVPTSVKFQEKFHSITLEWRKNSLKFFLNDENEPYLSLEPSSTGISNFNYPFNESFYLIINLAIGGEFDNNLIDPSAMCFNRECSNHDDPNSRRFIIDWIEYAKLD